MNKHGEIKKQYLLWTLIFVVVILSLLIYYNRQKTSAQDTKTSEEGKTQFPAGVVTPDVDKPDLPIQTLPTAPSPPPSAAPQAEANATPSPSQDIPEPTGAPEPTDAPPLEPTEFPEPTDAPPLE